MNKKQADTLTKEGIGLTHYNMDIAAFNRWNELQGKAKALHFIYRMAFARGRNKAAHEVLSYMKEL